MLHKETVPPNLLEVLETLLKISHLNNYRLVGGTALSLQYGHRQSVDIDLFTDKEFDDEMVLIGLRENFSTIENERVSLNGITCLIKGIKVDIYSWKAGFIRDAIVKEGIRMASAEEIAAMKLDAISMRVTKKDYYDIVELLDHFSLKEMIGFYSQKYPRSDIRMVIDAFTDFNRNTIDLENSEDPITLKNLTWNNVKGKVVEAFSSFVKNEKKEKTEEVKKRKEGKK